MKIKTLAPRPNPCDSHRMAKRYLPFIIYNLSLIICAAASLPLTSLEPVGYFDDAEWVSYGGGDLFQNREHTDSRYAMEFSPKIEGPVLSLSAEAVLGPSNSVVIALGDNIDPEGMTLRCVRGTWSVYVGGQIRGFSDPLPAPITGTHTYKFHLSVDTSKGRFTSAVSVGSMACPLPPPSAWTDAGVHPANWTLATVSLRGRGAGLKSLRCEMTPPATLIIVR